MKEKRLIESYPDAYGHGGWKHICQGGEICSGCGVKAQAGEQRVWESSMDQDDLFCLNCVELVGD